MNYDKVEKNLYELIDERNTNQIIRESIQEIKLCKLSVWQYLSSIIISIVVSLMISFSTKTVSLFLDYVDSINEVILVLLGVVFGAYSIFQALLGKSVLKCLIEDKNNILKQSNRTFLNLTILYICGIVGNIVLKICLKIIPSDFLLIRGSLLTSNIIALILITSYSTFMLLIILETITFAINLYKMFCTYNTTNILELIDEDEDEDEE